MVEQSRPARDHQLRVRANCGDLNKGLENAEGVLTLLDSADGEEDWTGAEAKTPPEFRLVSVWFRTEALAIAAVPAPWRPDPNLVAEAVLPECADCHPGIRVPD